MSHVNCPHCGYLLVNDGSMSGQVVACPQCGGHLQLPSEPKERKSQPRKKRKSISGVLVATVIGVALFVGLCVLIVSLSWVQDNQPIVSGIVANESDKSAIRSFMQRHANDPSSIEYIEWNLKKRHGNNSLWHVPLRAKNAFGALIINEPYFFIQGGTVIGMAKKNSDEFIIMHRSLFGSHGYNAY